MTVKNEQAVRPYTDPFWNYRISVWGKIRFKLRVLRQF